MITQPLQQINFHLPFFYNINSELKTTTPQAPIKTLHHPMLLQQQLSLMVNQLQYLRQQNILLKQQNSLLQRSLVEEKLISKQLRQHHEKNLKLIQELSQKTLDSQVNNTNRIIEHIGNKSQQIKENLQLHFSKLSIVGKSSINNQQLKEQQIQQAKSTFNLFELNDFFNKVKSMHKTYLRNNPSQKLVKDPSTSQIIKWIKSLSPLTASSQNKLSMSNSLNTLTKIKPSKIKQNQSPDDQTLSKSKLPQHQKIQLL